MYILTLTIVSCEWALETVTILPRYQCGDLKDGLTATSMSGLGFVTSFSGLAFGSTLYLAASPFSKRKISALTPLDSCPSVLDIVSSRIQYCPGLTIPPIRTIIGDLAGFFSCHPVYGNYKKTVRREGI